MNCQHCHETIKPSLKISIDPLLDGPCHCPYCLATVPEETAGADAQPNPKDRDSVSVARLTQRREAREHFVDELIATDERRRLHCPICEHSLSKNDELLLRNSEHFRCGHCSHDLADVAYRRAAYAATDWNKVAAALETQRTDPICAGCSYLGAIAKASQMALSWTGAPHIELSNRLRRTLARSDWAQPTCDWTDCTAVGRYQSLTGAKLRLL